ncbi:MAG: hypothetical protein R3Y27_01145 [Clostridia bacterium]
MKKILTLLAAALVLGAIAFTFIAFDTDQLTTDQARLLSKYDTALLDSDAVVRLAQTDDFAEFIAKIDVVYNAYFDETNNQLLTYYKNLGIDVDDTLASLAINSQKYLDENYDEITLDSAEYVALIGEAFYENGIFYELHNDDEPDGYDVNLASLYVYTQCYIYYSYTDSLTTSVKNSTIRELTADIIDAGNFDSEYVSEIMGVLSEYTDDYKYVEIATMEDVLE